MKSRVRSVSFSPTFRGRHNEIKCKAWLLLYDRQLSGSGSVTLSELTKLIGANYHSLAVLLKRWVNWKFLGVAINKEGHRCYFLRPRGVRWIQRHLFVMPVERYIEELEAIQGAQGRAL